MNNIEQILLLAGVVFALFGILVLCLRWFNPDREAEYERAKKDVEDMLKQADQEVTNRPRVRAINE